MKHLRPGRLLLMALLASTLLSACFGPKEPPPTRIEATLVAAKEVNPDLHGRPSPLVVRLYQLKSANTFESADFFSLYEDDQALLGSELVTKEELQLAPEETHTVSRPLQPETRWLGVIGLYRDLEHARWRALYEVPLHRTSRIEVHFNRLAVTIAKK